jgi:hypothetical protein
MITSQRATLPDGRPVTLTWEVSLIRLDPATQGDGWAVDEVLSLDAKTDDGIPAEVSDEWIQEQRDILDPDELASEAADDACDGPDYDEREPMGWSP